MTYHTLGRTSVDLAAGAVALFRRGYRWWFRPGTYHTAIGACGACGTRSCRER